MSDKPLRRDEASKFFWQYATSIQHSQADDSKNECNLFTDLTEWHSDLVDSVIISCKLWLFKWSYNKFMPTELLTNGQAITVIIRMIDGKKDESQWHFAQNYFEKAQELWIMKWLSLNSSNRFDDFTTRWEVAILLYNVSKLRDKTVIDFVVPIVTVVPIVEISSIDTWSIALVSSSPTSWELLIELWLLLWWKCITIYDYKWSYTDKDLKEWYIRTELIKTVERNEAARKGINCLKNIDWSKPLNDWISDIIYTEKLKKSESNRCDTFSWSLWLTTKLAELKTEYANRLLYVISDKPYLIDSSLPEFELYDYLTPMRSESWSWCIGSGTVKDLWSASFIYKWLTDIKTKDKTSIRVYDKCFQEFLVWYTPEFDTSYSFRADPRSFGSCIDGKQYKIE